jgi:hypothetical protein
VANFRVLRIGELRRTPLLGTWVNRAGALEDYTRGRIQSGNRYRFDGPTASFAGRARARALGRAKWRIAPVQLRGVWGGRSWPVRTGGERSKKAGEGPPAHLRW